MERQVRSCRWCFTLNNPTEEEIDKITALECEYLIFGKEHMEESLTPHLQGYVVFKNLKRFGTLKRYLERCHWEKAIAGHKANIDYCSKEDTSPYEKGIRPVDYKRKKADLVYELEKDIKGGHIVLGNKRTLVGFQKEQEMYEEIINNLLEKPEVIYVYGDSGTGKTYWAIQDAVTRYGKENCSMLRFKNNFAISNNPQADALILPEFRPSCIDAASFLEFTDGYGMILNVKHGQIFIRPKAIYICSIKHPDEIYKDEINEQFKRRITRFMDKNENPYAEIP